MKRTDAIEQVAREHTDDFAKLYDMYSSALVASGWNNINAVYDKTINLIHMRDKAIIEHQNMMVAKISKEK